MSEPKRFFTVREWADELHADTQEEALEEWYDELNEQEINSPSGLRPPKKLFAYRRRVPTENEVAHVVDATFTTLKDEFETEFCQSQNGDDYDPHPGEAVQQEFLKELRDLTKRYAAVFEPYDCEECPEDNIDLSKREAWIGDKLVPSVVPANIVAAVLRWFDREAELRARG